MSVIVKGMRMPDHCWECWLMRNMTCGACGEMIPVTGKRNHCPLVALPDNHGDLIDRDALRAVYGMNADCADCEKEMRGKVMMCEYDRNYSKMDFCGWIDDAPPIVEAEGKE